MEDELFAARRFETLYMEVVNKLCGELRLLEPAVLAHISDLLKLGEFRQQHPRREVCDEQFEDYRTLSLAFFDLMHKTAARISHGTSLVFDQDAVAQFEISTAANELLDLAGRTSRYRTRRYGDKTMGTRLLATVATGLLGHINSALRRGNACAEALFDRACAAFPLESNMDAID